MSQLVQTAATTVFSWHAWALAIAMAVGLEEPAKRLGAALRRAEASHEGARFVEREILDHLLRDLAGERVILHVKSVHLLTMDARRWLVEAAEKHPHLLLVVSILADDGDEVMPLHMIRRGLRRFDFELLDVAAIRELLDRRLAPNAFPRSLSHELRLYSGGRPGQLGLAIYALLHGPSAQRRALFEDDDLCWQVDLGAMAEVLGESLYEPISRFLDAHPQRASILRTFLYDAAFCGRNVPVNLLLDRQELAKEVCEKVKDLLDDTLVESLGLFKDLEFHHPGFPKDVNAYRFRDPLTRLVILDQLNDQERELRATELLRFLRRTLPVRTRDIAHLFVDLSENLNAGAQAELLRELEWWVGRDEAEVLTTGLIEALLRREVTPDVLWGVVRGSEDRWPDYRRLAVLVAYGKIGVPLELLGAFHLLRANLLMNLGRFAEALDDARQAYRILEAHKEQRSNEFLQAMILLGLAQGKLGDLAASRGALEKAEELCVGTKAIHPLTKLNVQLNLAHVMIRQGDCAGARMRLEIVLAGYEFYLGLDHRLTLVTRHELAVAARLQGDFPAALHHLEALVATEKRIYGPEHPFTLATRHNLVELQVSQGDITNVRVELEAVLAARERVIGPDHPDTEMTRRALAGAIWAEAVLASHSGTKILSKAGES